MAELKVTSGKAWRTEGTVVKLPSGKVARLRKPDAMSLLAPNGQMPDSLIGFIMDGGIGSGEQSLAEALPEMLPLFDRAVLKTFIEPKVLKNPEPNGTGEVDLEAAYAKLNDDEIFALDVDFEDKMWIFSDWLMGGMAAQAGTFPAQQSRSMDAVPDLNPVHTASE